MQRHPLPQKSESNSWCCYHNSKLLEQSSARNIIPYAKSANKKYINERISLAKRRANTCQLANPKKKLVPPCKQPPINTKFDQFYTPQQKTGDWEGSLIEKHEQNEQQPHINNINLCDKIKRGHNKVFLNDSSFLNDFQTELNKGQNKYKDKGITRLKKINFIYRNNNFPTPIQFQSEGVQVPEFPIKKPHMLIEPTVNFQFHQNRSKLEHRPPSNPNFTLNKQSSKPITLNYSSFQQHNKSIELPDSSLNYTLPNDHIVGSDENKKNSQCKSMQMTNLPTQRCMNSIHDSMKNSSAYNKSGEKILETPQQHRNNHTSTDLNNTSNITHSINGSQHSQGRESMIVELTSDPESPLSPHILKLKSQRQSKVKKESKIFFLSQIKL